VHGVSAKLDVVSASVDDGSVGLDVVSVCAPNRWSPRSNYAWRYSFRRYFGRRRRGRRRALAFSLADGADEAGHVMPEAAPPIEVSDVCDLDADRGPSSAVVERFTAVRCARADSRRDYANRVSKLQPRGCSFVPVVGELAAVVRFDADDV
jgi:hypothetical protein